MVECCRRKSHKARGGTDESQRNSIMVDEFLTAAVIPSAGRLLAEALNGERKAACNHSRNSSGGELRSTEFVHAVDGKEDS
jgi:hypothetical protein